MKTGFIIALVAAIAFYFANISLSELSLATHSDSGWKIIATGWHIFGKMWPVMLAIIIGMGIITAVILHFLSASEEKDKESLEKQLKEISDDYAFKLEQAFHDDQKLVDKILTLRDEKEALERKVLSKVNHQHSTIQRLHKKISRISGVSKRG